MSEEETSKPQKTLEEEEPQENHSHRLTSKLHQNLDRKDRNKVILLFTFRKFLKLVQSKVFRFLEVFINVYFYENRFHLSYFNLEKMKTSLTGQFERQLYFYLKMLTINKIKKYEKESKEEVFDIEKAI